MSGWSARRFWTTVSVAPEAGGYGIRLDARPLRSPAKRPLILPTEAMALALADEWRAVEATVDPGRMPVTRAANSAIDKVTVQFDEVADLIAAYGGTDLLCYRAEGPADLVRRQAQGWDPWLDWAATTLDARLVVTTGITPIPQPESALRQLDAQVRQSSPFQLTALHDLVSLTGSLILGLAATRPEADPEALWSLSRIDEDWEVEQWGEDEEASSLARRKHSDFLDARRFWLLATA